MKFFSIFLLLFLFWDCQTTTKDPKEDEIGEESKNGSMVGELNLSPFLTEFRQKRIQEFQWRSELSFQEYVNIQSFLNDPGEIERIQKKILGEEPTPSYANYLYIQKIAGFEIQNKRYNEAIKIWEKYLKFFPKKSEDILKIIAILKEPEPPLTIEEIGTDFLNKSFYPVPEMTGTKVFISGLDLPEGKGGMDIYESKLEGETWGSPRPLAAINSNDDETVSGISMDGTELFITGRYKSSYGVEDIFASFLTEKGWTNVRHFRQPINTEYFDFDASKTPDGKGILFVSDRPGGYFDYHAKGEYYSGNTNGNSDIYVSFREESGAYATPINLGPIINTPGSERTPYLHSDGKTLYFSSNGLNGLGEFDIYKSVRLDDTWQNWTEPVHLGKQINGPFSDLSFKITAQPSLSFLSREEKPNQSKIFSLSSLPKKAKPEVEVQYFQGIVTDEYNNPIQAEIEWQDLDTGKIIGKLNSRPVTGEFFMSLPSGSEYAFYARKKGYVNLSLALNLKNGQVDPIRTQDFRLVSIGSAINNGWEVALNNVYFEVGKDSLVSKSSYELERVVQILKDNPDLQIEIRAFVTSNKQEEQNLDLSTQRAEAIKKALVKMEIAPNRILVKGYGSSSSTNPDEKEKANRVAYRILLEP
ncbi:MAG: OmpA family protein [Leptospiraceae bacterium]|nr:OmpA family protein [Leptospiraceae bacterium]